MSDFVWEDEYENVGDGLDDEGPRLGRKELLAALFDPTCKRKPSEIEEYVQMAKAEDTSPDEFVLQEEGTLNPRNGHFACTECYIKIGQPSSPTGWVMP